MKILIRNRTNKDWHLVESATYGQETELQQLLAESPEIISIGEVRPESGPLVAAVREISLPIGSIDLLAFSAEGDIALIECKLASNPEVKRKVIGQIMEYSAHLWEMRYEELDEIVRLRSGVNLAELVEQAIQSADWDEENFRNNVAASLESGNFILMIIVDEISEDLARIVRYINVCGSPNFDFAALEMRRFYAEGTEMLVPRVLGPVATKKSGTTAPRKQWDEPSFFKELDRKHGEDAVQVARRILEWAQQKMQVWWGKGKQFGSFVPLFDHNGRQHQLFAIYTSGVVETYFYWHAFKPPFDDEAKRIELMDRLNQIEGVAISKDNINKRPSIRLTTLREGETLEQFLSVYDWVLEEILKS